MVNLSLWILILFWRLALSQTILENCPQSHQNEINQRVNDLIMLFRKQDHQLQNFAMKQRELIDENKAIKKVLNAHAAAITNVFERLQATNIEIANGTGGILNRSQVYNSVPDLPTVETFLHTEPFGFGKYNKTQEKPECFFDLIFLIDSSGSNCPTLKYREKLQFCKNLLEEADIDSGQVRVGMLTYSSQAEIQFYLNTYSKKRVLFDAIDRVTCSGGETYTADALSKASNVMFTFEYGDRPDANNIIVLITDGFSNINESQTIPEAEKAKKKNIQIYTISINDKYFATEVLAIASTPTKKYAYPLPGMKGLQKISKTIYSFICEDSNLKKESENE